MADMLVLTAHLPERRFAADEIVVREGEAGGAMWVLVQGALDVARAGVAFNTVDEPGAVIGEISALLGGPYGATVTARVPSVLRQIVDAAALLEHDASVTRLVAEGLARRLQAVSSYLVDLKQQYGDAPGLAMVPEVLRSISQRQGPPVRPGSAREPDPEY